MEKLKQDHLDFLKEISENNNKPWYEKNKVRYQNIKKELLFFSSFWHSELMKFDETVADYELKPYMFRIHKDARFAKGNKYKTNFGILIGKNSKPGMYFNAGYYLHLEPGNSFLAGGAYMPDGEWLDNIREKFIEEGDDFRKIITSRSFKADFEVKGNKLKTGPRGFKKDHKEIELLKYKSIYAITYFSDSEIISEDFLKNLSKKSKKLFLFNNFLNK